MELAIDFGTRYLKFAFFDKKDGKVRIIYSESVFYNFKDTDFLEKTLEELIFGAKSKLNKIIFGFSSLPVLAIFKKKEFQRQRPLKRISRGEISRVIKDIQKESFLEIQKKSKEDLIVAWAKIKKILLNGREIKDPIERVGKQIQFEILNLYLPSTIYKILSKFGKEHKIDFQYIPEMVAEQLFKEGEKNLIIDIGGLLTEMIFSEGRTLHSFWEIPLGGESLNQEFKKRIGFPDSENLRAMRMIFTKYKKGFFSSHIERVIEGSISYFGKKLHDLVLETLKKNKNNIILPSKIYFTGGGSKFLKKDFLTKNLKKFFGKNIPTFKIAPIYFKNFLNLQELDDIQMTNLLTLCR